MIMSLLTEFICDGSFKTSERKYKHLREKLHLQVSLVALTRYSLGKEIKLSDWSTFYCLVDLKIKYSIKMPNEILQTLLEQHH